MLLRTLPKADPKVFQRRVGPHLVQPRLSLSNQDGGLEEHISCSPAGLRNLSDVVAFPGVRRDHGNPGVASGPRHCRLGVS